MFARAYATSIRPISLGRQIIGFLDLNAAKGVLPDRYEFFMNSADLIAFAEVEEHLARELSDAATQHCIQCGYQLGGSITVILKADDTVKSGDVRLEASAQLVKASAQLAGASAQLDAKNLMIESEPPSVQKSIEQTEISPAIVAPEKIAVGAALVLANGQRFELSGETVKIGRHESCSIVFADSNVSRVHAQLQRGASGWLVVDLGSTNGIKVNGTKIQEQLLADGDELVFGTSTARFVAS